MEPFNETLNRIQTEVKRGQIEQAKQLATQLCLDYPEKSDGWLWLSWLSEEAKEALHYAQYAANLEDKLSTQQALQWAKGRLKENHTTKRQSPPFAPPKPTKLTPPEPPTTSEQWQPFMVGIVACMLLLLIVWQMPQIKHLSFIAATPKAELSQDKRLIPTAQKSEEMISQSDILDLPITQANNSALVSPTISPLATLEPTQQPSATPSATPTTTPTPTATAIKSSTPSSTPNTAILLENQLLLEGAGQPPNPSLQSATPLSQQEEAELNNQPTLVVILEDDLYFEDYTSNPLPTPIVATPAGPIDSAYALWPVRDYPVIYVVQAGDNITSIAERVGLQPDTLIWANDESPSNPELVTVGQELLIPAMDGVLHLVKEGDTLNKLAEIYHIDAALIAWFPGNKIKNSSLEAKLDLGERIMVPGGVKPATPTPPPPRAPAAAAAPSQVAIPPQATAQAAAPAQPRYTTYFGWPTGGQITQVYSRYHGGIDIAAPMYTPILAAQSGQVSFRGWDNTGYGYSIVIDHRNGWYTRYAHLSGMYVELGDWVERGEVIALMGSTGRSTGPHLHFEIMSNGYRYNPYDYLP